MRLVVREVCPESRLFRPDGERLRHAILAAWSDAEILEVDFQDEPIASVSFLDEGIAALFADYDADVIRGRLHLLHMTPADRGELNRRVAAHRSRRATAPLRAASE